MTHFLVKKVAVLGAGVMGAQIAAHCINAKVPVILFDLPAKEGPKNGVVSNALLHLKKLKPAPFGDFLDSSYIEIANYEDDLEKLKACDIIIEAVAERMDIKRALYHQVAPFVRMDTIFASNTSGLSITALSEALPAQLKAHFCGVHFFNPPRYMHLVELIPTNATNPLILDHLETFLTTTLGKGVIRAKDTPNFIANRVGIFGMLATIYEAEKFGLTVDVVDDLTGKKLGRASSGTFRTADVVGLDTMGHVIQTMQETLTEDPFFPLYQTPAMLKHLITAGKLGQKTGSGFYQKKGKDILRFDFTTKEYVPSGEKADEFISRILKEKDPAKRMKALRESTHPQAQFLWAIFRDTFHYIALHLADIAYSARDIDFAMRWGFGWQQGPFEIWQAANWQQVAKWVNEDIMAGKAICNIPLPEWVFDGEGRTGVHTPLGSWCAASQSYVLRSALPVYHRQLFRAHLFGEGLSPPSMAGTAIFEDDDVRIWHKGSPEKRDDVLVLSFKTKMHIISSGVVSGLARAISEAEKNFKGLVIWATDAAEGGPFSAGADLQSMLPLFASKGVAAIEPMVSQLQNAHMAIKYAQVPVVAAIGGLTLGGGCEMIMHAAKRVALMESYIGLVEVGVGLIPAGGGLKEIAVRVAEEAGEGDLLPILKNYFTQAAMATVSTSAIEAKRMGYLRQDDVIVLHPYELLYVAKNQVRALHESGYRAPLKRLIKVGGRYTMATMMAQLVNMRDGSFISEHDYKLASMIAEITSGGEIENGSLVDEQWLLDKERQAFMTLLSHPKTQERIMGMMQTGKPVRN